MPEQQGFERIPPGAVEHYRLCFYAAVLLLGDLAQSAESIPAAYLEEVTQLVPAATDPRQLRRQWDERLAAWENDAPEPLPMARLRVAAGLDRLDMGVLFLCGLPEEDSRFGRPTSGWLAASFTDRDERDVARRAVSRLMAAGLLHVVGADGALHVAPAIWAAIRGDVTAGHTPVEELPTIDSLLLAPRVRRRIESVAATLGDQPGGVVAVRGAESSGRRTVLRAIAQRLGLGTLEVGPDDDSSATSALASLLGAMPIVAASQGDVLNALVRRGMGGPIGVRLSPVDRLDAPLVGSVDLTVPSPEVRLEHWQAVLPGSCVEELRSLAQAHRLTGGAIRRAAPLARAEATAAGRTRVEPMDVTLALRAARPEPLGDLAGRIPVAGCWDDLAVSSSTREELLLLEQRCRGRERLPLVLSSAFGDALGPGVRALFSGPSGTGKTLSARLLASVLGKDLYRLDLSGVVNKYLGETEKNLDRVFGIAEALDVVLLIDEGDVLLGRRTDVHSSNDRYANLETNYLLQRLESFQGIVVITTNAEQHIDGAFARRLDVVVEFSAPGPEQRCALWEIHLPADHRVSDALLGDLAGRCGLTGGQVRNAVLHAALLALDDGGHVGDDQLIAAVRREYRKSGSVCPLRSVESAIPPSTSGAGTSIAVGVGHG